MDLTEKDLNKLRFQKGMSLFLFIILSLVTAMMVIFGFVFVFIENEETAGKILGAGFIIMLFLTLWVRRHYRGLKADLKGGVKNAVQGVVESKMRHRSNCDFTINGVTYHVSLDAYLEYEKGDHVLISFGPASKVMLDIQKIED